MTTPDISIIVPVVNDAASLEATVRSALACEGPTVEVLIVDGGSEDETRYVADALCLEDARVRFVTCDAPGGALEARRRGLGEARGQWVSFLDAGRELVADGPARAIALAERFGVSLAAASADGREYLVPDGSVVHSLFSDGLGVLSLAGVVAERELALEALQPLPHQSVPRESELVVLFALCYAAPGIALVPGRLASDKPEAGPGPWTLEEFEAGCLTSKAAAAVGRLISRFDDWDCHRGDYQQLVLRLLEPLVAPFPGNVAHEDRGAAFEALANAWPAPELASAVAHWKGDNLTPLLEAASLAPLTERPANGRVTSVALLCQGGTRPDVHAESCSLLGVEACLVAEESADVPDTNTLPAWEPGESYLPRARALIGILREHGVDAVAAPLVGSARLALDLLCARLVGVPTLLVAEQGAGVLLQPDGCAAGAAQQTLAVAQCAEVLGCLVPGAARFWTAAAPEATVVPMSAREGAEECWSRLFDALEEEPELDFAPPRASVFSNEVASIARSLNASRQPLAPAAASARIRELEQQTALLEARLAAAHDEARALRQQLVEAGRLPAGAPRDLADGDWL